MTTRPSDRRRYPRKAFKRVIGVLYYGDYQLSQVTEKGEGGLQLSASAPYRVDDQILMSFFINADTFVAVRGIVRNQFQRAKTERACGVEFIDLPLNVKRIIRNIVADGASS